MDEVGFESLKQTIVFVNIDDYPINTDDLGPNFDDILKALHLMGFRHGYMHVKLYCNRPSLSNAAEIIDHLSQCESYSADIYRVPDITFHMIRYALYLGPGPINFLVIAKKDKELERVLHCLKSRHHNVLLVNPTGDEESLFSLLMNAQLLGGGGKPRFQSLYSSYALEYDTTREYYVDVKEDVSKTVDFSERIPSVKGFRTAVFWDAEDCPFPLSSTSDEIYQSITSALVEREFSDNLSIWAYLDDDKKEPWKDVLLGNRTWTSRIYFLPGGNRASRRIRMLNDIYLWMRDSPRMNNFSDASLFIVSSQFKYSPYYTDRLRRLSDLHYDIVLVHPTLDINKPESPEWPGLLIDGGACCFGYATSVISEEPSPENHEAEEDGREEPCPKEHREVVMSVLKRYDALRRRFCQLSEAVSGGGGDLKAESAFSIRTNTKKRAGIVPGVEIGDIFFSSYEMGLVGLHSPPFLGGCIDYLVVKREEEETMIATSIVSYGCYDPDVFVYTGQGGNADDKEKETWLERGNLALEKSLERKSPVRVIRELEEASQIYIYDGLYEVTKSWGKSEYKLVRVAHQTPAFATWTEIQKWKAGWPSREGLLLTDPEAIQNWKDGWLSRQGHLLTDLASGVESIAVPLVNNFGDEELPDFFYYSKAATSFELQPPFLGCDCSKPGNLKCHCSRKNGGDYPYCGNGLLVSRKPMIYECSPSCVCENKVTQMGIKLKLEVFMTRNRGWGLRSWDPIRAGSFICVYAGEAKVEEEEKEELLDDDEYCFDTRRVFTTFKWNYEQHGLAVAASEEPVMPLPLIISGKDDGNVARFMNHSCSPNVFWQPVSYEDDGQLFLNVAFFAVSHIPPMTELTYDYGVTPPQNGTNMCFCGSQNCRGSFG